MTGGLRAQLVLPLKNRAQFLEQVFSKPHPWRDGDQVGLFVPGEVDVALGELVDVELHFGDEGVRFHVRALVKWKRSGGGRRSIPPGIGIEFLANQRASVDRLLRFAEGKESVNHVERNSRRYAIQIDVKVTDQSGRSFSAVTDDISEGGCALLTDSPVPIGARVEVRLRAPGSLFGWMTLDGVVSWRRVEKDNGGLGVEFLLDSAWQRRKVRKIVAVLKERALRDVQVRVPKSTPPTPTSS